MLGSMLAMKHECIWTNKGDIFYNQIVLMDAFIMNKLQVGTTVYFNGSPPLGVASGEKWLTTTLEKTHH